MTFYQAEYKDPQIYDAEYGGYLPDGPFFETLASEGYQSILDLACGTGRLTIPLAKKGLEVTGLEILTPMLNLARQKSSGLKIHWVEGDCRTFDLGTAFDLIVMGGNAFQAMLNAQDQRQLFERVKNHLSSNGQFAFNTRTLNALRQESQMQSFWHTFIDPQRRQVDVYGHVQFDEVRKVATYYTERRGPDEITRSQISLKFTPYGELKALIEDCGLSILEVWGSADKKPYTDVSESMYLVCGL